MRHETPMRRIANEYSRNYDPNPFLAVVE